MKKLGIIGHFGGGHEFLDGQTVKTKVIYEELAKRGYDNIFCVDTYYNKTNKLKLMWDTFRCVMACDKIIMLLSTNGLKVYLPIMYYVKKFMKRNIYHNVVGGHLHTDIARYSEKAVKYLNSLDSNWVETEYMKKELEKKGITNCDIFTNFKNLNLCHAIAEPTAEGEKRFCMFSRVMEEKGITDAIEAVSEYNKKHGEKVHLNIWGPINDDYKEKFDALLKARDCVTYGGMVDFDKSVVTLTDHVALIFPTRFVGEGCPGTIIDAYASGLPVISSEWNAAGEMVKQFQTGWVYPNDKVNTLEESIEYAMSHKDEMIAMRKNCKLMATRYTPDFVVRRIIEKYLK